MGADTWHTVGTQTAPTRHEGPASVPVRDTGVPLGEVGDVRGGAAATIAPRGAFPPFAWTRRLFTPSSPSSRRASASRRSRRALPGRARVSEAALPLVLATLYEELGRGLVVLLPEDADARDAAEGASWFLGDESGRAAPEPRRLARLGPRAAAAPRRRAGAGTRRARRRRARVCVCGGARGGNAAARRPAANRCASRSVTSRAWTGWRRRWRSAGYERVDRVEERGQFAVRGGIVDVFPSTGREPLRVELFGDEIEQVRAFSPFTQRALHTITEATDLSRRRAAQREHRPGAGAQLGGRRRKRGSSTRVTSSHPSTAHPISSGSRMRCVRSGTRRG